MCTCLWACAYLCILEMQMYLCLCIILLIIWIVTYFLLGSQFKSFYLLSLCVGRAHTGHCPCEESLSSSSFTWVPGNLTHLVRLVSIFTQWPKSPVPVVYTGRCCMAQPSGDVSRMFISLLRVEGWTVCLQLSLHVGGKRMFALKYRLPSRFCGACDIPTCG